MSVIKLDKYLNSFFKLKLQDADKELYNSISDEFTRQQNHFLVLKAPIESEALQKKTLPTFIHTGLNKKDICSLRHWTQRWILVMSIPTVNKKSRNTQGKI